MTKPLTVLFFGPPGAGKTTQFTMITSLLQEKGESVLPFSWSNVRDSFMEEDDGYIHKRLKELHVAGERLPLFFSTSLWGPALMKEFSGTEQLLVNGLPRHEVEAQMFDSLLDLYKRDSVDVLNFTLSGEAATERLKIRSREDDNDSGIQERLKWYQAETLPLLNFFNKSSRYRVHDVDVSGDSEEIHSRIKEVLGL